MRDLLDRLHDCLSQGWCQNHAANGSPYDPETRAFCVFGALCRVLGHENFRSKDERRIMDHLNVHARKAGFVGIIAANDDPTMTHARILEIVREARNTAPE